MPGFGVGHAALDDIDDFKLTINIAGDGLSGEKRLAARLDRFGSSSNRQNDLALCFIAFSYGKPGSTFPENALKRIARRQNSPGLVSVGHGSKIDDEPGFRLDGSPQHSGWDRDEQLGFRLHPIGGFVDDRP